MTFAKRFKYFQLHKVKRKKEKGKKEKYFNEYERYFTAVKIIFRSIKKSYSILNVCIYIKQIIGRLNEEKGMGKILKFINTFNVNNKW